jgi:hypothetical protein
MKNTDRLENFVRAHREEFDSLEPSPKVWNKIRKNQNTKTLSINRHLLRIAAVIAVATVFVLLIPRIVLKEKQFSWINDPQTTELLDTEKYYAHKINEKLKEIRKCYPAIPGIKEEVEADLLELEAMYQKLKNDLQENVSNRSVIEAMIENNRNRLELVESVLKQINC